MMIMSAACIGIDLPARSAVNSKRLSVHQRNNLLMPVQLAPQTCQILAWSVYSKLVCI